MLTSINLGVKIKKKKIIKNGSAYEQFRIFQLPLLGQKVLFSRVPDPSIKFKMLLAEKY